MNGTLYHACQLTAAAKHGLAGGDFRCQEAPYIHTLRFLFRDGGTAEGAEAWFHGMRGRGLVDVKLLTPTSASERDRDLRAFVNGVPLSIAAFYRDGTVTHWQSTWSFEDGQRCWDIVYQERLWENSPAGRPRFEDQSAAFSQVLAEIEILAEQLGEPWFAQSFAQARQVLEGGAPSEEQGGLDLPPKNGRLFAAASRSDLFGGMGSWNDSPPYEAEEKGMKADYDRLSAALHTQLTLAVLYAVNEW